MNVMRMKRYLKGKIMDDGLYSYRNVTINKSFLDEVWRFDPNTLESKDSLEISKYSIALAQYLIYFRSEYNKTRAILAKKKKTIDSSLNLSIGDVDKTIKKRFSTKAAITEFLLATIPELSELNEEITSLQEEINYLDGMDRAVAEYIATFKRELTRREKELYSIRSERKN